MDWRIVLKTCSALNASWALKFALCAIVKDFRPPNSSASRGGKRPRLPPMYILSGPRSPDVFLPSQSGSGAGEWMNEDREDTQLEA